MGLYFKSIASFFAVITSVLLIISRYLSKKKIFSNLKLILILIFIFSFIVLGFSITKIKTEKINEIVDIFEMNSNTNGSNYSKDEGSQIELVGYIASSFNKTEYTTNCLVKVNKIVENNGHKVEKNVDFKNETVYVKLYYKNSNYNIEKQNLKER